jgi:hypothetical protein
VPPRCAALVVMATYVLAQAVIVLRYAALSGRG